jgi:hypothetical protein
MVYGISEGGVLIGRFAAPLTVRSNQPVFASDTLSLKRQAKKREAQRWEIQANIEPLNQDANALFVHLVTKGITEAITVIMPQNVGVLSKRTSVSTPTATGSVGATSVNVASNTNLIPRGTFIKFANHSKVYMTTSDRNGNGSMGIFPSLRVAVSTTIFTHRDDVQMTCLCDMDTITGMIYTDGILMDMGSIKLIERL